MISAWWLSLAIPVAFTFGYCWCGMSSINKCDECKIKMKNRK